MWFSRSQIPQVSLAHPGPTNHQCHQQLEMGCSVAGPSRILRILREPPNVPPSNPWSLAGHLRNCLNIGCQYCHGYPSFFPFSNVLPKSNAIQIPNDPNWFHLPFILNTFKHLIPHLLSWFLQDVTMILSWNPHVPISWWFTLWKSMTFPYLKLFKCSLIRNFLLWVTLQKSDDFQAPLWWWSSP